MESETAFWVVWGIAFVFALGGVVDFHRDLRKERKENEVKQN